MKIVLTESSCKMENCTELQAIAAAFAMVHEVVESADSKAEKRKLKAVTASCIAKMLTDFVAE